MAIRAMYHPTMIDENDFSAEGGCACAGVRYRITSRPMFVSCCHCRSCQRAIGAGFVTWVAVKTEQFDVTKGKVTYCETSPGMHRGFCGRCGSSLSSYGDDWEDTFVTAASLENTGQHRISFVAEDELLNTNASDPFEFLFTLDTIDPTVDNPIDNQTTDEDIDLIEFIELNDVFSDDQPTLIFTVASALGNSLEFAMIFP